MLSYVLTCTHVLSMSKRESFLQTNLSEGFGRIDRDGNVLEPRAMVLELLRNSEIFLIPRRMTVKGSTRREGLVAYALFEGENEDNDCCDLAVAFISEVASV